MIVVIWSGRVRFGCCETERFENQRVITPLAHTLIDAVVRDTDALLVEEAAEVVCAIDHL